MKFLRSTLALLVGEEEDEEEEEEPAKEKTLLAFLVQNGVMLSAAYFSLVLYCHIDRDKKRSAQVG